MRLQADVKATASSGRNTLRALVIGAGPAAVEMHLPVLASFRDQGRVTLALICDLQPERATAARRKFGFADQTGDGIAALARADIDVVYVFASAQLHFEFGLAALRAGKHLFVEKPIAPSYAGACELAQAAKHRGLVAVGGHNRRFYASLTAARELAGKAGWQYAEAAFHKPEFGRLALFGAHSWLSANGIHALDALVFMMNGLPEHVSALATAPVAAKPTAFSAVMRWRDGAQAVFACNNNAGARLEQYAFHGLAQTCRIDDEGLTVEDRSGRAHTPSRPMQDSIGAEHDAFLRSIREGVEPPHRIAAIAPSLFLGELIERGFSGPVLLPKGESSPPSVRPSSRQSILIMQAGELQPALARLLADFRLVSPGDVQTSDEQRPDIVAAILGRGAGPLPPELLAKLPRLRIVGIVGLSLARHEPETLLARGVMVVNATQAYAASVAEFALGLAILARRRAFVSHEAMRRGSWGTRPRAGLSGIVPHIARKLRPALRAARMETFFLRQWRARGGAQAAAAASMQPRELRGATVGLIGWSANARAFAELLLRANARVLVYSEHAAELDLRATGITRASLGEALAADIVSLHRGLTPATRHFLGAAELQKLRSGAVLINIARGALIEPRALLDRLKQGDLFACLDTYETEPPAATDPLRKLPNVFLTSHIAGGSGDMHAAAAHEVVRKIADHLAGSAVEGISDARLRTMS